MPLLFNKLISAIRCLFYFQYMLSHRCTLSMRFHIFILARCYCHVKKITVETIVMVYHCIFHDEVIGVHHNPPTRLHIRRKLRRGAIAFSNNKI